MKSQLGYRCVLQVLRTANVLWRGSRRLFRPHGLTEAQFNVLNLLAKKPEGMSQRELSDELLVDRSNITLLLDRMGGRGWVMRHDSPKDRRSYRVKLTPEGEKLWKRTLPSYEEAIQAIVRQIPSSDLEALLRALEAIERHAESHSE